MATRAASRAYAFALHYAPDEEKDPPGSALEAVGGVVAGSVRSAQKGIQRF
jgi:hypothetical protein